MLKKKKNAFGLVETLIASTVIILVVASLTAVSSVTLTGVTRTEEHSQAVALAQEGIEIVRQIRDTNWIDNNPATTWNTLFYSPVSTNWHSIWDLATGTKFSISYDLTIKRYYLADGDATGAEPPIKLVGPDGNSAEYSRYVTIDSIGDSMLDGVQCSASLADKKDCAMRVTVHVLMESGAKEQVSEILTNWRPNY